MINYTNLNADYLNTIEVETINTNKKVKYLNIESAFDIETTSINIDGSKSANMYIWMFGLGLGNEIFFGRTWDEFVEVAETLQQHYQLSENNRLIVYVHSLGYEFQFMRKYFDWVNVFAINERKPIKALCSLGIEFRDSYILSGYSLENTAKNLAKHKVKKLVGNLDYSLPRHHLTPLTPDEMDYCSNDIEVILAYINEQIEQYVDITKVPLTNTGRVRDYVRHNCYYTSKNHRKSSKGKYFRYRQIMKDLTLDSKIYKQLKTSFMGGFTHSNPNHTGKTLDKVSSIDLTSSYPTVMLSDKFPMSRARELHIDSIEQLKQATNKYCIVFDVLFTGLTNKIGYESYLSESKCRNLIKPTINNGRIFEAEQLAITITDVDFSIIERVYSWETIRIKNVNGFVKSYLPKSIIESILNLYEKKTTLKGVEGSEVEYLLSKGMLNSVYGMSVTDVVKDNHTYTDSWEVEPVDLEEKITEYNESRNRFLYYPWGIWVTAYARRNLWSAILNVGEDYIYSDTDSVKMFNYEKHEPYINSYNDHVTRKLTDMINHFKLDVNLLKPKTVDNIEKPLGVWELEGHYEQFKTLGAKRYLIKERGEYHLTVAGLSKKNGINYIIEQCENDSEKIFNLFDDNLHIPAANTGKMTHTYIDEVTEIMLTDYLGNTQRVESLSAINLESCDFTLSISEQYNLFLQQLSLGYYFKGQKNL